MADRERFGSSPSKSIKRDVFVLANRRHKFLDFIGIRAASDRVGFGVKTRRAIARQ
jgi:hypothetical protein